MLKKIIAILGSAVLTASLYSCSTPAADNGSLSVVCTVFPCYDWAKQVIGDTSDIELTYLLSNGSDIHSFQPTADDIIKISDCDVFIYVGGESDAWADKALENARNKDMTVVRLMDVLSEQIVEEEHKEGMAEEHSHGEHEGNTEYDEHIWLSLSNAEKCVSEIWKAVKSVDEENSALYTNNAKQYIDEIKSLDSDFHALFDDNPQTLIFGDRFPFRYMTEDYGLDYYAAFTGCSAETEASFETVTFLAEKADELNAPTIFTIENSDCTIADAVIANTKTRSQNIKVLDSIQSVNKKQIDEGATYLTIMKENYEILKEVYDS
ncbi:MAG: zinc ABC transporter substrate-binding protein [Ruminococcus sp.]|nr:zinc ABC transporter substrate-binding protein [Ruminococcus sp.]